MMNDELICNGQTLDLSENIAFPITFSINDIKDPSKRKRTTSLSVTLEGTRLNKGFFREMYGYHSTGDEIYFDPTARVSARYKKNGNDIITDGVLQLHSVTIENGIPRFKVQLYSESVDVFLTLSSVNVSDLDWSDLTHSLSRVNIKSSWTTPSGQGYRYPIIQYRPLVNAVTWRTTDLVPYVHLVDVVKRIMAFVGMPYRSNFLSTNMMKNVLFGFGGGDYILNTLSPIELTNRKVDVIGIGISAQLNKPWLSGVVSNLYPSVPIQLNFTNVTAQTENSDLSNQYDNMIVNVAQSGNYNFKLTGRLRQQITGLGVFLTNTQPLKVQMCKNGIPVSETTATPTTSTTTSFDIIFDFNHDLYMEAGDVFTVMVDPLWNQVSNPASVTAHTLTSVTPLTLAMTSTDTAINDGQDVLISRFIPEMKCSDFLMGVFRQFNLVMSEPDFEGVVDIEPLKDFYTPTNDFEDVSDKVDYSKPFEITPTANTVSKNTIFEFKKIDDYDAKVYLDKWGGEYGNYNLLNTSHYAPKNETKISLPWGTIIPFRVTSNIICPRFIVIDDNGAVKPSKGAPRIMFWNGLKSGNWTLRNTFNSEFENLTSYPCVHHFDNWQAPTFDLNFSLVREMYLVSSITRQNSYSVYYQPFYSELLSPHGKLITCYLKLDDLDVKMRNFKKLKMINNMLFRLNTLGAFDSNKAGSTKVELLRVVDAKKVSTAPIDTGVKQPSTGVQVVTSASISAVGKNQVVLKGGATTSKVKILGLIK